MNRGQPLTRKTAIRRKTRLAPRRATERRSERKRDTGYLARAHTLPGGCWAFVSIPGHRCRGRRELDHAERRPLGRKCDDKDVIILCRGAHRARTAWSGEFKPWDQSRMRSWLQRGIAWTQALLAAQEAKIRYWETLTDEHRAAAQDLSGRADTLRPVAPS